jgi:hypothetical protein
MSRRNISLLPILCAAGTLAVSACAATRSVDSSPAITRDGVAETAVLAGPIVLRSQTDVTLRNIRVANADGDCIEIDGSTNIVLDHVEVGPCKGRGVHVHDSRNVEIKNSTIRPAYRPEQCCDLGSALLVRRVKGLVVASSVVADAEALIELLDTHDALVDGNELRNPWGPFPRGQMVQLQNNSSGVTIRGNNMRCNPAEGCRQEDAVNIYSARGVTVEDNRIEGPISANGSGCGILIDGYGARDVIVRRNHLVGQADGKHGGCGVGVAGGDNVLVESNRVSGYGNIAFYVWAQPSGTACHAVTLRDNVAGRGAPRGGKDWFNAYWNGGGCGAPILSNNSWQE